ncbi:MULTISPECIES: OmpA family protein [Thioalkalivibrio]|uniref:OmpA family protein n=1 Tax=Thioalkalivibrio TaxID=106633 RepID=UPI00037B179B|nr:MULTISPECIES: OmpA family protein [Thioalkalivibrio]
MSTIFRRNSLAVIVATLLLTGCELMPTRDADTASEPSAEPSRERAADSDDGASQDQSYGYTRNGLYLARNDQDISERRQRLLDEGHESVATDRVGFYMDVLTARLRQDLANQGVELSREDRTITLTFAGDLAFETNSATIHPDMVPILDALGQVLEEYHASIITVAGHTDSAGARQFNQHLSEQRALSVAQHLHAKGIGDARIMAIGHGPDRPIADNDHGQGRALNRRVELRIEPLTAS